MQTVEEFYLAMFAALENDSVMREVYEIMILKCEFVDEFAHVLERMPLDRAVLRAQLGARHTCAQRATSDTLVTRARLDELERLAVGG